MAGKKKKIVYRVVKKGETRGPLFLFEEWARHYVENFLDEKEYEVVREEVD